MSMYKLEVCDDGGKDIVALRKLESLKEVVEMVLKTAREFPEAKQWILRCMGKCHSVWERTNGRAPRLTSSVVE